MNKTRKREEQRQTLTGPHKKVRRQMSLSNKVVSKLSMSFYDDITVRKNKQIIVDCCQMEEVLDLSKLQESNRSNNKNIVRLSAQKIKRNSKNPLQGKQREELDISTTEASKLNNEQKATKSKVKRNSRSKSKKSSEKYKKQLFADVLQNRSKMSKILPHKQDLKIIKKH